VAGRLRAKKPQSLDEARELCDDAAREVGLAGVLSVVLSKPDPETGRQRFEVEIDMSRADREYGSVGVGKGLNW
jgi:hypothetical protein